MLTAVIDGRLWARRWQAGIGGALRGVCREVEGGRGMLVRGLSTRSTISRVFVKRVVTPTSHTNPKMPLEAVVDIRSNENLALPVTPFKLVQLHHEKASSSMLLQGHDARSD